MNKTFENAQTKAEVRAISSKSEAHRALICAALSDAPCFVECNDTNNDIDATARCLCALGAKIERRENGFFVDPISKVSQNAKLDAGESGSTLRFLIPLAAALGANCRFLMRGRLPHRPLSPMYELLAENGVTLSPQGSNPLIVGGELCGGNYAIAANVSSQYVSGLLFALSVSKGKSTLKLTESIESAPYILMTLDTLLAFGADIAFHKKTSTFTINGKERLCSPSHFKVGGDWSNAAFFLCAGAIGNRAVTVCGLDESSRQGDRAILDVLKRMGARITRDKGRITVYPSKLCGIEVDASDIPDLVPIICTAASVASGTTTVFNASRLRLKESDRIRSVCSFLSALGADITPTEDGMTVRGRSYLSGGTADSANDHRIAMSAAVASLACKGSVTVSGFEAINKSYPSFLENFQ